MRLMVTKYATQLHALGFRIWHERRLVHAHLYLTLCVVALVWVATALEGLKFSDPFGVWFQNAVQLFVAVALAAFGWLRYQRHMLLASELGHYVTCPQCSNNGAVTFLQIDARRLRLRCKKCTHEWTQDTTMFAPRALAESLEIDR